MIAAQPLPFLPSAPPFPVGAGTATTTATAAVSCDDATGFSPTPETA
jgi:hypothetical protein